MFRANLTSLWSRKLRLIMSLVAIVLGVAFVSGSFVFGDMMSGAFTSITRSTISDVDVAKDPAATTTDGTAGTSKIDQALVDKVKQVPGVTNAAGYISVQGVTVIASNGKAITSFGPPQLGMNYIDLPAFDGGQGLHVVTGRAPQTTNEIAIDPDTLRKSGYQIGDTIKVLTPEQGAISMTVVGTATYGSGGTAGATYALMTTERMQQLAMGSKATFMGIWVVTSPDADRAQVAKDIQAIIPDGYLARDGEVLAKELDDSIGQALGFVNTFLLVFAGIALLVASFLIMNTFTMLVAQRSKELALFRAMGASRGQVLGTVLGEASVLGLVGAVIGVPAGIGLAFAIKAAMALGGWDLGPVPVGLDPIGVAAALITGVGVTVLASLGPARRATRIAPVEAMTAAKTEQEKGLGARAVIGTVLAAVGAAAIVAALTMDLGQELAVAGIGMALALIGVAIASPLLGRPVVWVVGRAYRALFGEVGRLATLNSMRQPRRTAATASALMIGLTLVTTVSIFSASAAASVRSQVTDTLRGDYVVGQRGFLEFPADAGDKIEKVDGVDKVYRMRSGMFLALEPGQDKPTEQQLNDVTGQYMVGLGAMQADSLDKILPQSITQGRMFAGPREMIVEKETAEKKGLGVGSTERYFSPEAQRIVEVTVVGIYTRGDGQAIFDRWVSTQTLTDLGLAKQDTFLAIYLTPGADAAATRTAIDAALADMPLVSAMDVNEYSDLLIGNVEQVTTLLYALLAMSIVIAVLGIVNTLGLSIVERTRELGLLRAIALTRTQVRRMITLESVVISLLGAVVGVGLGWVFGVVLQKVMPADQGITVLEVPYLQLAAFVVAAGLVGVLAAAWPAQRAARTNVLEAIAAE
ncbi:ABC transporter permease [Propionibacteriaceae bacterium G57]|uniref:ABC transporter permease n=1 Tax=Aestuariimicrobium sp. G57 TaxID=3418485 RepID=UPI003DA770A2